MSAKYKKKSVLTSRNAQEKSNVVLTVIYYKMPPKHRHRRLDRYDGETILYRDYIIAIIQIIYLKYFYRPQFLHN